MPETGPNQDDPEFAEYITADAEVLKGGWEKTLQDMRLMAEDRRDRGYETLEIGAGDTAPESPDAGETDRFGLVFVMPGDKADRFAELYEDGEFGETAVYQKEISGRVFLVVELVDEAHKIAIFVAGQYAMRHAPGLVRTAMDEGVMFTHFQTLDTTHYGSFKHGDVGMFFPNPERFLSYEPKMP